MKQEKFNVTGMTCAACSAHVEKAVAKVPGVQSVAVSLLTNSMQVGYDSPATAKAICKAVEKAGLVSSGVAPDGTLVETVELGKHPFFLGVQYHPEFKSRPNRPHPVFLGFVQAAGTCVR